MEKTLDSTNVEVMKMTKENLFEMLSKEKLDEYVKDLTAV